MKDIVLYDKAAAPSEKEILDAVKEFLGETEIPEKTLLIPPDFTRMHSGAGLWPKCFTAKSAAGAVWISCPRSAPMSP